MAGWPLAELLAGPHLSLNTPLKQSDSVASLVWQVMNTSSSAAIAAVRPAAALCQVGGCAQCAAAPAADSALALYLYPRHPARSLHSQSTRRKLLRHPPALAASGAAPRSFMLS
jgi:hypothetical protein